jgi:hypothetical protein
VDVRVRTTDGAGVKAMTLGAAGFPVRATDDPAVILVTATPRELMVLAEDPAIVEIGVAQGLTR